MLCTSSTWILSSPVEPLSVLMTRLQRMHRASWLYILVKYFHTSGVGLKLLACAYSFMKGQNYANPEMEAFGGIVLQISNQLNLVLLQINRHSIVTSGQPSPFRNVQSEFKHGYNQYSEQSMNTKRLAQILSHSYRQLIEFLNNSHLPDPFTLLLIYLPSLAIFADLIKHIHEGYIWDNLTHLSLASLLLRFMQGRQWLVLLVLGLEIGVLLVPVGLGLALGVWVMWLAHTDEQEIGYFKAKYETSVVYRFIRAYMATYHKLGFPVVVSTGSKLASSLYGSSSVGGGVVMLLLAMFNSVLFYYYDLDIPFGKGALHSQSRSYPRALIDNTLILLTLVLINMTSGILPFIFCLVCFCLRVACYHFLRYEHGALFQHTQFCLFCSTALSMALLVGHLSSEQFIMLFCAGVAVGLLLLVRGKWSHLRAYERIDEDAPENRQEITIDSIKGHLCGDGITKTFREAVLFSRKKVSHRERLAIDIIKSKCYDLERVSRGSIKTANSLDLLNFESMMVAIIKNFLAVQEKAIQTLSLLKSKEPKQQLFIKLVTELVDQIDTNKQLFERCVRINAMAAELTVLMDLFFRKLFNDTVFMREIKNTVQEENYAVNHRLIQKQLFSKDKALLVLNVLDEVGKISRASHNLPNVLGYSPQGIVGLSINEIIPFSIRKYHDEILTTFVKNFTSEVARKKPSVEFYAYDKSFHLQKVEVRYKFFMHFFKNFELSGIVTKKKTEDYVVVTDKYGNIEGWTPKIGELFNFDEIAAADCYAYNICPMLPAYIKHNNESSFCFRTIFFRTSKMKTPKLMLFDLKKHQPSDQEMKTKQIEAFQAILNIGQFIQGYLVSVEVEAVRFAGDKLIKVVRFHQLKRIQNFEKLEEMILLDNDKEKKTVKAKDEDDSEEEFKDQPDKSMDEDEDISYSLAKSKTINMYTDFNFTLNPKNGNNVQVSSLKFSKDLDKFHSMFSSRNLIKLDLLESDTRQDKLLPETASIESSFDPKLERKSSYMWVVVLISVMFMAIVIQNFINLSTVADSLSDKKEMIRKGNRAEMIFCKTVFNPNRTYISQFADGNLLIFNEQLLAKNHTFVTFDGNAVVQNVFYLLNVQIPSTLGRIVRFGDEKYRQELINNFYNIILKYDETFKQYSQLWQATIDTAKQQSNYKLIGISFGLVIYELFLVFIYRRYTNQMKMIEAFFKFEKSDIDTKIAAINLIQVAIVGRCQEWFIDQQLPEIKKNKQAKKDRDNHGTAEATASDFRKDIINKTVLSHQDTNSKKLVQGDSDDIEVKMAKKRLYFFIGLAVAVAITQVIFLILQGVLTSNMMNSLKDVVKDVDKASKLVVLPNMMMANLYQPAPAQILTEYQNQVNEILNSGTSYLPNLLNLLQQKPCPNCPFLNQILSTNYRSFYSYLFQTIRGMDSNSNITELYYAVDVVAANIGNSLDTVQIQNHSIVCLLYIFSLLVFFVSVVLVLRDLNQKCTKLQCFLKFFNVEALLKNKHMSTVMAKNM